MPIKKFETAVPTEDMPAVIVNRRLVSQKVLAKVAKLKGVQLNTAEDLAPNDQDLISVLLETEDRWWGSEGSVRVSIEYVPKGNTVYLVPAPGYEIGDEGYREQLVNVTNLKAYKV
jgi:hypothetical protein